MSRRVALLIALVALVALQVLNYRWKPRPTSKDWSGFTSMMNQSNAFVGRIAPVIEATTLDGEPFVLADVVGTKMIVLNFFATWCEPCREEMPEFIAFAQKYAADSVLVVGIDAGEGEDEVRAFVAKMGVGFPVIADRDRSICMQYGVRSYPTTVVVNLDGSIGLYEIGMIRNAEAALEPHVQANRFLATSGAAITRERYLLRVKTETDSFEFENGTKTPSSEDEAETP